MKAEDELKVLRRAFSYHSDEEGAERINSFYGSVADLAFADEELMKTVDSVIAYYLRSSTDAYSLLLGICLLGAHTLEQLLREEEIVL